MIQKYTDKLGLVVEIFSIHEGIVTYGTNINSFHHNDTLKDFLQTFVPIYEERNMIKIGQDYGKHGSVSLVRVVGINSDNEVNTIINYMYEGTNKAISSTLSSFNERFYLKDQND